MLHIIHAHVIVPQWMLEILNAAWTFLLVFNADISLHTATGEVKRGRIWKASFWVHENEY